MKTTLFLLSFMLYTLSACGQPQDFERLSDKEVRKNAIHIGERFINEFYEALEKGTAYQFTADNATPEVRQLFTPEMQITTFEQIKTQLGEYEDAAYAETWVQRSNPNYTILRYKAKFSDSTPKVEIRVVLDESNKIAGFFVKPWSDVLN